MWEQQIDEIIQGNTKTLARCISYIENEVAHYEELLQQLPPSKASIIGITGPPGAGNSTLVDALIGVLVSEGKSVAVICVDPSSPFNLGALLGDRIRMSEWYNNPKVFIRSLATRGSLGGLHPKMMEIADVFVVNKADRPDADLFVKNLRLMLAPAFHNHTMPVPVIKTIASHKEGVVELLKTITVSFSRIKENEKRSWLLAEKAFHLIQQKKMMTIDKTMLKQKIEEAGKDFNLYAFIKNYY